jgi:hypothetical protein
MAKKHDGEASAAKGRSVLGAGNNWVVVDNWPVIVPVTRAEIDALETYLGALIDEILGGVDVGK